VIELLCTQLSSKFCEIDQLAGILLRFCQEHVEHLRLAYDSDVVCDLIGRETDTLQEWFEEQIEEDWLDESELGAVAELLRGVARRVSDLFVPAEQAAVVAARVAADALDRAHGHRFAGVFRGRGVTRIKPGDPLPVSRPPVKDLFRDGANPWRFGPQLHELVWLRILPHLERDYEVLLSFESDDVLADLRPDTRMGVAIPSGVLPDLDFDRTDPHAPRFFHVRPTNGPAHRQAILALLDEAEQAGARILILPELSADEDILQAVERWFSRASRVMSLLVCGSMHVERDGQRRNVSPVLLPGGRRIEHAKLSRASLPLSDADGTVVPHAEDITTDPPVVTVLMCGDWSFTVLIGTDLLEPGVNRIIEIAGVRLVLVPACAVHTDRFEPVAGTLAARNLGVVLVANLADPGPDHPASVIIARPSRENSIQRVLRSELNPPRLLFFYFARSHEMDS
jgi:predicted amidohydrolase